MQRITLLIVLLSIVFACKKTGTATEDVFTFVNLSKTPILVVLYGSEVDYIEGKNSLKKIVVGPTSTSVEITELGEGKEYYADYYNEDYSISNWCSTHTSYGKPSNYIKVIKNGTYTIQGGVLNLRGILLNNNNEQVWKAIDAYEAYTNKRVWDTLSTEAQNVKLTASYRKIDYMGLISGMMGTYSYDLYSYATIVSHTESPSSLLLDSHIAPGDIDIYPVAVPVGKDGYVPKNTPASKDTICVLMPGYRTYLMVKQ